MNRYYKLLGLQRNASKEEIKQAYRKMVMQCHPDKHGNSPKKKRDAATAKFKRLSEAYEVLMNKNKNTNTTWSEPKDYYNTSSNSSYYDRYTYYSDPRYGKRYYYGPHGCRFTMDGTEWPWLTNVMAKGMLGFCCFSVVFFPSLMAYNLVYDPLKQTILGKFKGNKNAN